MVYGTGRIDESSRVADRAMTGALGWQPGDRLNFTAAEGVVIARRDPAGMITMPAKPSMVIPGRAAAPLFVTADLARIDGRLMRSGDQRRPDRCG